ncbi:TonB-dependent receptor [Roseateles oligotrophus]|uniref:TonB-dependent receptor n=1 Tax=Roseateles oligotrophus TaxID=1769250 RepID=A0ABT2YAC5_9BURK|nr:TonB-dependent receptor [Roseateles oligotrophus]MCV2367257.1 TonB-dependent receptor [Roseateles oligotrophus]
MDKKTNRLELALRQQSGIALAIACLFAGSPAWSQTAAATAETPKPASAPAKDEDAALKKDAASAAAKKGDAAAPAITAELDAVLVIGARASQRSSIERKRTAATAVDSIVAEDVGAFPDRNIGEAISRIAGVALDRGDFGEGTSVSIRGNGPELTRVELDGMGVRSGAGTDLLGGGDGRGTEYRELSSDLIKSVDIVKGSTAAMTEGSLGGGVIITTRTGLDFKKPYYSLRVAATQSDLNKKTTPNFNLVLADKFLDSRLGVIVNLNKSHYSSEQHGISQGGSNNQQGLVRLADFDNSPEKTFTFNPATAAGDTINNPMVATPLTGGGNFNSSSITELLTKSAAAQSKAACFAAFPNLSAAQTASMAAAGRTAAYTQRQNEQSTCLNQWNDYTPSNTAGFRYNFKSQDDKRNGGDIRLDFKVSDDLTVYGKYSAATRTVEDVVGFLGVGSNTSFNGAGTFVDNASSNVRTVSPTSPFPTLLLPNTYSWRANNQPLIQGATTNILPGYTVDSSHHVTSYSTANGSYNTDTIFSTIDTDSKTMVMGGEYRNGRLRAQFLGGSTESTAQRYDRRAAFGYNYGVGNFALQPNGLWAFTLPDGSSNDQLNFAKYAQLNPAVATSIFAASATNPTTVPAFTAAQRAQYTNNSLLQVIRSFDSESSEKTGKLDIDYDLRNKLPFFTSLKGGLNLRDTGGSTWWGGGGAVKDPVGTFGQAGFVPGVYLPSVNGRWNVIGCENTPGSKVVGGAAPGQPCAYGYVPSNQLNAGTPGVVAGTNTLTQAQYEDLVRQTMTQTPAGQFYAGSKDRPSTLTNGWNQLDVDKLFQTAGIPVRLDCMRECKASDGKVYAQPVSTFKEKTSAAYLMTDFEIDNLPFGLELTGNFGARVVRTEVEGTGYLSFRSVRKTATFDPLNPTAVGGTTTTMVSTNTSLKDKSTDVLPSLNLALWPIADKLALRYSLGRTIARPPISKLLPSGGTTVICTNSQVIFEGAGEGDGTLTDQGCSGTMGNPGLKPQTNVNQNLSLEWFATRDTMFTVAGFRQKGIIGAPTLGIARQDVKVFQGSNALDPVTGQPLSDLEFSFNQWGNQDPSTRRGLEFGMKTAFNFLPSILRYTGLDANYSRVRSTQGEPRLDLISGDILPIVNEPKYSYNASLWYDDGGFSARVALQVVAPRYQTFSPNTGNSVGVNNYPSVGTSSWRLPYNPGAPIFGKGTSFIDAKLAYRFKNGLELFADVRNLTGERTQTTTGGYQDYADGIPSVYSDGYSGRRYMVGFNIRTPQ